MRRAFTIIELLVVFVIVAVLVAIAVPVVLGYQDKSMTMACLQNLRSLGTALNLYLADNDGIMPTMKLGRDKQDDDVPVIDNTLSRYTSTKKVFMCPADKRGIGAVSGTSYHWNNALNGQAVAALSFFYAERLSQIPLMGDKDQFHRDPEHKVNILYADGSASKELTFVSER